MSFDAAASRLAERVTLPHSLLAFAINRIVAATARDLALRDGAATEIAFARAMAERPVAEFAAAANAQHYELPPRFFELVLGPQRKYSCCLYDDGAVDLAAAEEAALAATAVHADLANGQTILELGCGWGSLSLWMAKRFPRSPIVAVSNSRGQRDFIAGIAAKAGLTNLRLVTADMNDFFSQERYDRIVSVEMFEHMANWPALLARIDKWLVPGGRLFVHVFSHRQIPYRFDHRNPDDWIAQHFFTGGIMPSRGLINRCDEIFAVEAEWHWSGANYQRTALDWLVNYERNGAEIETILRAVYGSKAAVWRRRWRLFFLATAGLFGHAGGSEWGISHYQLAQKRAKDDSPSRTIGE